MDIGMNPSQQRYLEKSSAWSLPLFLTQENKYHTGVLMFAYATAVYLPTNHFQFTPPQLLPMTWMDHLIPFMPNSIWIYLSEWAFFAAVYIMSRDLANLNRTVYAFVALQTASVMIFMAFPTTFPRALFPLPQDMHWLSFKAFEWIRNADTPANCAPSLHVSSVYLFSFMYLREQREKFLFFFLWASGIAFSTMSTKQHYWIDVVTGFAMAVVFYWLFYKKVGYRGRGKSPISGTLKS